MALFTRKRIHDSTIPIRFSHKSVTKGSVALDNSAKTKRDISKWFKENLINYCNTTSLHGFNYITIKDITYKERFFWILVVAAAIIVSVSLVLYSWYWNQQTPTVTVIESSHFPTWNIRFPAVTICNFNKISKSKAEQLLKKIQRPPSMTEDDIKKLFRMTMYFGFAMNQTDIKIGLYEQVLQENNLTLSDVMKSLAPDCMDMITRCLWKGTNTRCDSLFQRIYTLEGVCCSFNYFARRRNNFPAKIAYQVPKRPYRVTGCGYPTGLSILLNPLENDYNATYFSSYGFRLLIHDAYNFPDENAETKVITSKRESFVRINPESTYATNDIKRMDMKLRNCLFENERRLDFMIRYSFINCMAECRIKMFYEKCGCIPESVPSNGTMRRCELKEIYCFMEVREMFSRAWPELGSTLASVQAMDSFPCNCMPDCETNHYVSEITTGLLNDQLAFSSTGTIQNFTSTNSSILLHVFFSDLMSTRFRMEIFQNWLSALASFGGLLGLIMGFSIVTAFEFLYFLTFRPVFNYFNKK